MDVGAYLDRIGAADDVEVSVSGLERLQRAHLTHVPFENLDVFHRRGVSTDPDVSTGKIVERHRGGWCYELNGAFATLLERLGFSVRWLGATVLPDAAPVQPDHLAIEVNLDRPYLVDVGFGDSFILPLPIEPGIPHDGGTGEYSFTVADGVTTLVAHGPDSAGPQYRFGPEAFTAHQFDESSHRLQTESGLQWTQSPFATRLLDGGPDRVTLLKDRVKFRRTGMWTEQPVAVGDEWDQMLERWFGMTP